MEPRGKDLVKMEDEKGEARINERFKEKGTKSCALFDSNSELIVENFVES